MLDQDGKRHGEILELSNVARQIQLIPKYGARICSTITSDNSLEDDAGRYFINSFWDKEVFQAVW